jgi:hypothetical protein
MWKAFPPSDYQVFSEMHTETQTIEIVAGSPKQTAKQGKPQDPSSSEESEEKDNENSSSSSTSSGSDSNV